eukprot:919825-Rhodomonas_salina.2
MTVTETLPVAAALVGNTTESWGLLVHHLTDGQERPHRSLWRPFTYLARSGGIRAPHGMFSSSREGAHSQCVVVHAETRTLHRDELAVPIQHIAVLRQAVEPCDSRVQEVGSDRPSLKQGKTATGDWIYSVCVVAGEVIVSSTGLKSAKWSPLGLHRTQGKVLICVEEYRDRG